MTNDTKRVYYPQLTWLRGIAALLVIISHTVRTTELPYSNSDSSAHVWIFNALDLGSMAVTLFFALSGATLYINHRNDNIKRDTVTFLLKRVFRIYPAFIVSLAAYLVMNPIFLSLYGEAKGNWMDLITVHYSIMDVLKHLFLFYDLTGNPFIINGAYWSLPVEFRYYLIFPIALVLLKKTGWFSVIALSFIMASTLELTQLKPSIPHFFILAPSFFGGMLAAYFIEKKKYQILHQSPYIIICLFAVASFAWLERNALPNMMILNKNYNWNIFTSVAIVYFSFMIDIDKVRSPLRRILTFVGNISYSMYLLHQLVLTGVFLVCIRLGITGNYKLLFIFPITVLLVLPLSWLSYKYVEIPGVNFYKRISSGKIASSRFDT